ncbi:hypothetical protein EV182_000053 [Spiromyces aspiralis]|uniref:Uncharacterized protein n=1 Tax=Spiromyces aspiralis TaxID=68401 RepID=A0ACC1HUY7_9FUNG|nr:hypothetical protein EV182_000053 [Spiromyces aspiralis]
MESNTAALNESPDNYVLGTTVFINNLKDNVAKIGEYVSRIDNDKEMTLVKKVQEHESDDADVLVGLVEEGLPKLVGAPAINYEQVYNQVFAVILEVPGERKDQLLLSVVNDLVANGRAEPCTLKVLSNLYNILSAHDGLRYNVFEAIVKVASKVAGAISSVVPYISRLPSLFTEWRASAQQQRQLFQLLWTIFQESDLHHEAYQVKLIYLKQLGVESDAKDMAAQVVGDWARTEGLYDLDTLASLPAIQALKDDATYGNVYALFSTLLSVTYNEWVETEAAKHAATLQQLGVEAEKLGDKIRALTIASLGAERLGQPISFAEIAEATQVPKDEIEGVIIDTIQAGLIQARMDQLNELVVVTRSTYRVFGEDQWQYLNTTLQGWKQALTDLLPVISNAKQQATHLYNLKSTAGPAEPPSS